MAGTERPLVYLDSNVLLDWVGRSQNRQDSGGVGGLVRAICNNKLDAVLSQVTRLEILECKNDPTMWKTWLLFQSRKNVNVMGVTVAIMDRAYEIRNYYQSLRESDPTLKRTPSVADTIHVATALIGRAQKMYTFDEGRTDSKSVSPLDMGPVVAGRYPLEITKATHDEPGFAF